MPDRGRLWESAVTYGAVGATQAEDLLAFPPRGYRPLERRVRVGHGEARWEHAWMQTLSWGIARRSGVRVEPVDAPPEAPAEVRESGYTPVAFDEAGTPVQPASSRPPLAAEFAPDGTAFVKPGDTAVLISSVGPFRLAGAVRVVYVIDEPQRKGFAYGTLPGHPVSGEQSFVVEHTEDGSVWLTVRSLTRPASVRWRLASPLVRIARRAALRRYLLALSGPLPPAAP